MMKALIRAGLALSIALASSAAWATVARPCARSCRNRSHSATLSQQRKDVDEGTRPPPPSGPSSQTLTLQSKRRRTARKSSQASRLGRQSCGTPGLAGRETLGLVAGARRRYDAAQHLSVRPYLRGRESGHGPTAPELSADRDLHRRRDRHRRWRCSSRRSSSPTSSRIRRSSPPMSAASPPSTTRA